MLCRAWGLQISRAVTLRECSPNVDRAGAGRRSFARGRRGYVSPVPRPFPASSAGRPRSSRTSSCSKKRGFEAATRTWTRDSAKARAVWLLLVMSRYARPLGRRSRGKSSRKRSPFPSLTAESSRKESFAARYTLPSSSVWRQESRSMMENHPEALSTLPEPSRRAAIIAHASNPVRFEPGLVRRPQSRASLHAAPKSTRCRRIAAGPPPRPLTPRG